MDKDFFSRSETSPLQNGLDDFIHYLLHKAENSHTTVLLAIGWNSQRFHIRLLLQTLKQCGLSFKMLEDAGI